jgi:hypothetical protein
MARRKRALVAQAPALSDADLLAERGVQYRSPLGYEYVPGRGPEASSTQANQTFTSKLGAREMLSLLEDTRRRLGRQPDFNLKVLRTFSPEPSLVVVRWEVRFTRRGDLGDSGVAVQGSSRYRLDGEGRVTLIEETWETEQEGARNQSEVFFNSLAFQLCHIPPGLRWWSPAGFVPAYKYAAFEAVKNDPKYGGQLIREEIDLFTMQSLYSILGLGVAVGLLALRVTELVLKKLLL